MQAHCCFARTGKFAHPGILSKAFNNLCDAYLLKPVVKHDLDLKLVELGLISSR